MQDTKEILKKETALTKPSSEEITKMELELNGLKSFIEERIKKQKISAGIFVGGSFAKGTLIKKEKYDIDIFVRFEFDKTLDEKKISNTLRKLIPKNVKKIHGSRDYFSLNRKIDKTSVDFEIIPVIKIKNPQEAKNIMDLSYFHVNYVKRKIIKNPRLADEIKLAKAFVHFQDCYGAESYINGFSGYALELLVVHYKSFINFIKNIAKTPGEKIVIDTEKFYKNREAILREVNEAKLSSPIILIDPTYKERNALAALSENTFNRFREACIKFLKNPSGNFFKKKDNVGLLEKKYKNKMIKLNFETDRQAGDIAGTKLKKFFGFLSVKIEKYFEIKEKYFEYDEKENIGKGYFVLNARKQIIFTGPPVEMEDRLKEFKAEHGQVVIKAGKSYAKEKNNLTFDRFLNELSNKDERILREMGITDVSIMN